MVQAYKHEAFTDFSKEENRLKMQEAIAYVESQLGHDYSLVIDGKAVATEEKTLKLGKK
ncbi:MAG: delta-pyrroline-5-carboxylate dehydrogenase [Bacillales bacterium]|nr:delta-pyrroline-5-carboxylate dehydrogenase [Bacillales bacterium]